MTLLGTVIDLETTGLPHSMAEVITLGLVSGNELKILQRTDEDSILQHINKELRKRPRPFYAFNKGFEEHFLGITIDNELQAFKFERMRDAINISSMKDPFDRKGIYCVEAWKRYKETGDEQHLLNIIEHNKLDLLLEACLVLARYYNNNSIL